MGVKLQRLLHSICSPHTFCLSQFLEFAVSSALQCQLTLLCFHFANGFLVLSALTVTFSSSYFSASLMLSLILLHNFVPHFLIF